MTELEWLAGTAIGPLTDWLFFDARASDRKLRLFSVACCRPAVIHLRQFASRVNRLLDSVEAFVDGQLPPEILTRHRQELIDQGNATTGGGGGRNRENRAEASAEDPDSDAAWLFHFVAQAGFNAALATARYFEERNNPASRHWRRDSYSWPESRSFPCAAAAEAASVLEDTSESWNPAIAVASQGRLLHDIFGNPFRPVSFSPEWPSSTAVALAGQMYEGRNFAAMPILADALEDAGCDSAEVLDHCRGPRTHVRGCWVVDAVLSKE